MGSGAHTAVLKVRAEVCLRYGGRLYSQKMVWRFKEIRPKLKRQETVRRFKEIRAKLKRQETVEFRQMGLSFDVV